MITIWDKKMQILCKYYANNQQKKFLYVLVEKNINIDKDYGVIKRNVLKTLNLYLNLYLNLTTIMDLQIRILF